MKNDLQFDESNLAEEWKRHANLYYSNGKKLADAKLELDKCKSTLEVVEAKLSKKIRTDPEKYGLDKITEASVTAVMKNQNDWLMAKKDVEEAKHNVDLMSAYIHAIDDKRKSMEMITSLLLAGVVSAEPKIRKAKSQEEEEKREETTTRRRRRNRQT